MNSNQMASVILSLCFLSACQKHAQGPRDLVGPAATQPTGTSNQNATPSGPSDGGGGDTCNGKMIESFRVDVTNLPEFKTYIEPILSKLQVAEENKSLVLLSGKSKNWYLIDCKLQDLPKERKGLYLESYQTAIHTSREIFIDSTSYQAMAETEKAKLLLHEMIMGYYLMKYLTIEEICKVSTNCSGDMSIASKWAMFRPQKYQPLNDSDHQHIREVTAWLWLQGDSLSPENFAILLKNNDFDQRFLFTYSNSGGPIKSIEVDPEALVRMFKKYQWSNSLPKFCQFDAATGISQSTCKSEVHAEIKPQRMGPGVEVNHLFVNLKITRQSDQREFAQEFYYPIDSKTQKISISLSNFGSLLQGGILLMLGNWPSYPGFDLKEGAKSQTLILMLDLRDPDQPGLYQVCFQGYVWYSFKEVISEKEGIQLKETYGYNTTLSEESESLFFEKEIPFYFPNFFPTAYLARVGHVQK